MMPGWASPGKPTSRAEGEAVLAAQEAAKEQEAAAAQDSARNEDSAAVPDAARNQVSAAVQESSAAQSPVATEESVAAADTAERTGASNPSASTSGSEDPSGVGQAIQSMTQMFEHRRQIQAQQNQPPPPSSN